METRPLSFKLASPASRPKAAENGSSPQEPVKTSNLTKKDGWGAWFSSIEYFMPVIDG